MKRRIFAWAILIGFVLLLLNLIVFRFYWQLSMVIYLVIVFAFMLTNGKLISTQGSDAENIPQGNSDDELLPERDDNDLPLAEDASQDMDRKRDDK